jgi:transcriptional antiterminator RfaH
MQQSDLLTAVHGRTSISSATTERMNFAHPMRRTTGAVLEVGVNLFDTCARTELSGFDAPWLVPYDSDSVSDRRLATSLVTDISVENPFLYPIDLLDATSGRCIHEPAGSDEFVTHEDPDVDGPRWWLIHTKPRHEKTLARELRTFDVPHYLPVTKCKSVTRGRTRVTRAPQFPGYLFLWGNMEQRLLALKTNRVVATHQVQDQKGLANQLWDLADLIDKGVPLRIEERLVAGQYVRVKSGPLRDKRGVIMRRAGKTRLFVLINELLGGVSLDIEQHLLEPY